MLARGGGGESNWREEKVGGGRSGGGRIIGEGEQRTSYSGKFNKG
jgi:hypothetical protein